MYCDIEDLTFVLPKNPIKKYEFIRNFIIMYLSNDRYHLPFAEFTITWNKTMCVSLNLPTNYLNIFEFCNLQKLAHRKQMFRLDWFSKYVWFAIFPPRFEQRIKNEIIPQIPCLRSIKTM
jgi:hypothetical protein